MKLLVTSFLLFAYAYAADIPGDFAAAGIVPDVLTKAPEALLTVSFKIDDKTKDVQFGEELTPTMVKDPPTLMGTLDDSAHYTAVMIDPDFPSREDPKHREVLMWMVNNIPGTDLTKGEVVCEYIGSAPGKDTGLHRYVLLIFKQSEKQLTVDEPRISSHEHNGRASFSTSKFAEKYKLGDPVAGNMFKAQYDDYVPVVMKQIGLA